MAATAERTRNNIYNELHAAVSERGWVVSVFHRCGSRFRENARQLGNECQPLGAGKQEYAGTRRVKRSF